MLPASPPSLPSPTTRVAVYIDGLNLFHSVLKGTSHKWLDLAKLMKVLRNREEVVAVKYFTAIISGSDQPKQQAYLNALEASDPVVRVILGHFQSERETCRVPPSQCVAVMRDFYRSREKQTDVGIAVEMVDDAHRNLFDAAVLVSGDSDLVPAVKKVVSLGKSVLSYIPFAGTKLGDYARELRGASTRYTQLPTALFPKMQLPSPINTTNGPVVKPVGW